MRTHVRVKPDLLEQVDAWAERQAVSRPEAFRRLLEAGLRSGRPPRNLDKLRLRRIIRAFNLP